MTEPTHDSTLEVPKFAVLWLTLSAALGVIVYVLIVFRAPVLAAVKSIWPWLDWI